MSLTNKDFAIFILQIEKERLLIAEQLLISDLSLEEKSYLQKKLGALLKIITSLCDYVDIVSETII